MDVIEGMWLRVGPLNRHAVTAPLHFDRAMESHDAAEQALCDLTALSRFPNTLQTKD
ncbi:hypothetical protein [Salipiger aestuarii]|uniref:Uncharacterized protein n=1 Tax=Salipiger aestuarii TaxID=568098 RepID=A0A327Y103_9RHOB|nr:hypothetical protein [Salipiger aestuarii]EIE52360.1 hypothetical protein C357_04035 [Citreicella sp. 357]RAK14061.1 hypothetical protein ATI53_103026 [Salipiger aestuarii]